VDAASIEVNRRARRAKTDRLDGFKLLAMLLRHHDGERVWSVLREPTPEQEDARRRDRELARLGQERTQHTNRIRSLLVLHNLRPHIVIGGRDWAAWWDAHGAQLLPQQRAEIEREIARLALIKTLEAAQHKEVEAGMQPIVAQLIQLRAIGIKGAWLLDKELFGWRSFANRRELAGSLGLVPTPYDSGDRQVEQGISKAGNKRVRALLVELAWAWLRLQPDSALTQWFNRRFASGGKHRDRNDHPAPEDDGGDAREKVISRSESLLEPAGEVKRQDHAEAVYRQTECAKHAAPSNLLADGGAGDLFDLRFHG